jgi:hypothetical protein
MMLSEVTLSLRKSETVKPRCSTADLAGLPLNLNPSSNTLHLLEHHHLPGPDSQDYKASLSLLYQNVNLVQQVPDLNPMI